MKKEKTAADRGKDAEKLVDTYLTELNLRIAGFCYNRVYDARSAGGKFPAQAGDYAYYRARAESVGAGIRCVSYNGLIEVKEVASGSRLPQKNFTKEKIGRLRKRYLAGSEVVILVYSTAEKQWRQVPFALFADDPAAPSWDLSQFTAHPSVASALIHGPRSLLR